MPLVDAALEYRAAGLSCIATREDKVPFFAWDEYKKSIPTEERLAGMFMDTARAKRVAIICGAVSGGLECLDFDAGGVLWDAWLEMVEAEIPGIVEKLTIETTPSGGRHLVYRCPSIAIPGSQKLAMRPGVGGTGRPTTETLIETRGEGAYFCAAPSEGYSVIQGDLTAIQDVAPEQRDVFLRVARFLNEAPARDEYPRQTTNQVAHHDADQHRPGDDYSHKCGLDGVASLIGGHGWTFWRDRGNGNTAWTRPGKTKGISATLKEIDGVPVFYVFSSSTPFDPMRGYSPFQVYAILEHGGDHAAAAFELRRKGYGAAYEDRFDLDALMHSPPAEMTEDSGMEHVPDPGPFPERLLAVPGFLGEFSDYINRRAVKRQPVLSLGAAIVAMGTLTGRKVEGITGLRTNFYVLGVAETGTGKNTPREALRQILSDPAGDSEKGEFTAIDRLKSDAGIRSALDTCPCVTFILDEIGEFLETIKTSKNSAWMRNIIPELMMLYSQAASPNVKMGGLGDAAKNIKVDCPHVCLYGTSVPSSVFASMTMHSVGGGFMGRLLLFESSHGNPKRQRPWREPMPKSLLEIAEQWKRFRPNGNLTGNVAGSVSRPLVVEESAEATALYDACEETAREEIERYGSEWSGPYNRVEENARKLGLLYACSENASSPFIGIAAAKWSCELALHLTRRLVYLGSINIADNETHDRRNKIFRLIVEAGETGLTQTALSGKLRGMKTREIGEIIDALAMSDEILVEKVKTRTKPILTFWANNCNNREITARIRTSQPDTS